ncbi:MAG TPA: tetratricopeptide repeat protein [Pyrinomonadaceae bacterium]|jgi:tetratricopeptide (TPR) repeat protein
MKNSAILFFLFVFALTAFGQPAKKTFRKQPAALKTVAAEPATETEEYDRAKALSDPTERVAALQAFIKNFPESVEVARAHGLVVSARAELADKKLESGETEAGIELFKLAVQEAPAPVPDELFTKVMLGFPISLYSRNQRAAAFDVVKLIEEKVGGNAAQVLDLAKFYINVQYGTEAIRLAKKSTELAPDAATGYLTLAIANRLNFQLEDAAQAYAKAAELDPESVTNKRSLAEMKRALGKSEEAIAIYRQLIEKDPADAASQTGLILALFGADKVKEAETELAKALETDPNNAALLTGAAYWYAAHNRGEKALEYSQKAIAADRNSVWSYIAQARGLLAQNKPLEAEKILLAARQFGDFPTLDYELASARFAAGLYREAAETLKRNFAVNKDGAVETYLGNRILADAANFTELLSLERRVALFETKAADSEENTRRLKSLLAFHQKLEANETTEDELALAAEEFASGGDNMRLHRQLFAASRLLQKKAALPKVLELTQSAIDGVDPALNVASPAAAVLADEIYDSRQYAISQNLVVVVPEIPRPTLSAILRGQIEDLAGRALLEQNNVSQAVVRLKRAMSVLPEKSAFSRASAWHLGEALQADGKEREALDAYIKGYNKDFPELGKRAIIENLYVKINGNLDGLDEKVGAKPETTVATRETKPAVNNTDNVKITEPTPAIKPEPTPAPIEPTPENRPEPVNRVTRLPRSVPALLPGKTPEATPSPSTEKVEIEPAPAATPENKEANRPEPPTVEETTDEAKTVESKPVEPKRDEVKDEVKPEETKTVELKPEETKTETAPRPTPSVTPLDEPAPDTENKPADTDETAPEKDSPENTPENAPTGIKPDEKKPDGTVPAEPKPTDAKPTAPIDAAPTPRSPAVIVTDNLTTKPTKPKLEASKTESKPVAPASSKSIFEPVVISVGKTDSPTPEKTAPPPPDKSLEEEKPAEIKPAKAESDEIKAPVEKPAEEKSTEQKPTEEKPAEEKPLPEKAASETTKKPAVIVTDALRPEKKPREILPEPALIAKTEPTDRKPAETLTNPRVVVTDLLKPENKPLEKSADEKIQSGENRMRIIITENTGAKSVTEEISGCKLLANPNSLALLNGGGALGVSVGFDGEGDFRRIAALSSSPDDLEVRLDAEIGARQNRAFFIVKSISTRTGAFTVTFEAPCGRKEILVKVR